MLYEIRNYLFEPTRFDEYRKWAETLAVPFIRKKWDLVGFWLNNEMSPEMGGSLPQDPNVLTANVTWIIRWRNKSQRDQALKIFLSDPEWPAIIAEVPGGKENYLRTEAKFATEI